MNKKMIFYINILFLNFIFHFIPNECCFLKITFHDKNESAMKNLSCANKNFQDSKFICIGMIDINLINRYYFNILLQMIQF